MSESLYWTWLSLRLGAASPYLGTLLARYASPKEMYDADNGELRSLEKIPESVRIRLTDKKLERAEAILADCRASGIGIMTYSDPRYPRILKYISKPPAVLYFKGQPIDFDRRFGVAIVGTRQMSDYGRDMAYKLSYDLASAGAVIISGMALGVDGMASAGALDAQAQTVAVLGGGIDYVYPREHRKLYEHILHEGLILSEYPPGSEPDRTHFPQRNRLISGLARCTLVVECPERSGALITAEDAAREGRPLFVVPGAANMENSVGSNELIKNGAKLTTSAQDILEHFDQSLFADLDIHAIGQKQYDAQKAANRYAVATKKSDRKLIRLPARRRAEAEEETVKASSLGMEKAEKPAERFASLSPAEKAIYDCIPEEGEVSMDLLVHASGQSVADVTMHILSLNIKGAVTELPGNRFKRT